MKHLLITLILIFIFFCGASAQTKKDTTIKKMTAQDSAQVLQIEYGRFMDSLVTKTSVKQLYDFLAANVTVKQWGESKWTDMYDFFLRAKGDEWIKKRSKH